MNEIEWGGKLSLEVIRSKFEDIRDELFWSLYDKWRGETLIPADRLYGLYCVLKTTLVNRVPGAIVECGVFRGGSFCFLMDLVGAISDEPRNFYAYDTFDGFPNAVADVVKGGTPFRRENWHTEDFHALFEKNLARADANQNVQVVRGSVLETIPREIPSEIAFLHLDTDYYGATKHQLEHLYPLLSERAPLCIDDYGHFEGCRAATDEFLSSLDIKPFMIRTDYAGRILLRV